MLRLAHLRNMKILAVVPAWIAGIQAHKDASGGILRAWIPALHAGMTEAADAQQPRFKNIGNGLEGCTSFS